MSQGGCGRIRGKGAVTYRLEEEQTAVIEEVRRVADESIVPHASDVDAQGRFPREAVDALAKAGLLGLTVPVEHGGMGHGIRVACAALDEIAQRLEYLLGALGGDLLGGFASHAARRGVEVDAMEASIFGRLNNPLVFLGVVGESGHPGFETISFTLYVSADAGEEALEEIWQTTLARSPLVNTLNRCVALTLNLHTVE